jgi:hypothetical protein
MWPFKARRKLARAADFPAVIDRLDGQLRSYGFRAEADRLHELVHHRAWTTSSELYAELLAALLTIRKQATDPPPHIAAEIRRLIKSINQICRWR